MSPSTPKSAAERKQILATLCPSKRNIAVFVARRAESLSRSPKRQKLTPTCSQSRSMSRNVPHSSCVNQVTSQCRPSTGTGKPRLTNALEPVVTHIDGSSTPEKKPSGQRKSVMKVNWRLVSKGQLPIGKREPLQRCGDGDRECVQETSEAFRKSSMSEHSTRAGISSGKTGDE